MAVVLDHLVIVTRDKEEGAASTADVLGLNVGPPFGHFLPIELDNGVTLNFYAHESDHEEVAHDAFRVSDDVFDHGRSRLDALDVTILRDAMAGSAGRDQHERWWSRVVLLDPTGNTMELNAVPYGGALRTEADLSRQVCTTSTTTVPIPNGSLRKPHRSGTAERGPSEQESPTQPSARSGARSCSPMCLFWEGEFALASLWRYVVQPMPLPPEPLKQAARQLG